jgi:hypothetical protein
VGTNDHAKQANRNTTAPKPNRYAKAAGNKANTAIAWEAVDGRAIKAAISAITACGDAITFGRTQDGGALSITVLTGADRPKFYPTTVEEAEDTLAQLRDATGL